MPIKIKIPEMHKAQGETPEVKAEVEEVQHIFDQVDFHFQPDTINFVFLKGQYLNLEKTMVVMATLVNRTQNTVCGIKARLHLTFTQGSGEILPVILTFPREFLGVLKPDEGVLCHISVSVKGLTQDAVYTIRDIGGGLDQVQYIKQTADTP